MTAAHPFYSLKHGTWRLAGELEEGEQLLTQSGNVSVFDNTIATGTYKVYNVEVRQWHNFLVGKDAVVVHNSCFDAVEEFLENHPKLKQIKDKLGRLYPGRKIDIDQNNPILKKICDKFGSIKICYDDLGFPDFSQFVPEIIDAAGNKILAAVEIPNMIGDRDTDYKAANKRLSELLGLSSTQKFDQANGFDFVGKDGIQYSWHHHQDSDHMILVPYELHRRIGHDGGATIVKEIGKESKGLFPSFKDRNNYLTKCK